MIRHVALFKFSSDDKNILANIFDKAFVEFLTKGYTDHKGYDFGRDLGIREGNFDYGVTVIFDDEDGYQSYNVSEAHQELLRTVVAPNISDRASLQFKL
ncbi:MAG: Dabb family protein [Actinomycetota bacterium]|nr:Dabb family protein [Actinomycetota bacterium]